MGKISILGGKKMSINIIDNQSIWDTFVDDSPSGLLFHKWDFLKIVEKYSGYTLFRYGVFRGTNLIGIFPFFYHKNALFRSVFSPPPQSGIPYLGFIMNPEFDSLKQDKKETHLNQVIDEMNACINSLSPNYISLSTVSNFIDMRPFKWSKFDINPKYTYMIHLDEELESIRNGFKMNLKRQLSHPDTLRLTLVPSNDLSFFYDLMKRRYEEQGLNYPVYSAEYIKELLRAYPDHMRLYYLYRENEVLGSIITQEYKRYITWMGNARMPDKIFGNEYIIWHLIQKAKGEGFRKFELTGADTKNLCQFKSKFNPSLEVSYEISKNDSRGKIARLMYINFIKKRRL